MAKYKLRLIRVSGGACPLEFRENGHAIKDQLDKLITQP